MSTKGSRRKRRSASWDGAGDWLMVMDRALDNVLKVAAKYKSCHTRQLMAVKKGLNRQKSIKTVLRTVQKILESKPRNTRSSTVIMSPNTKSKSDITGILVEKWNRVERSLHQFLRHQDPNSEGAKSKRRRKPVKQLELKTEENNLDIVKRHSRMRKTSSLHSLRISDTPSNHLNDEACEISLQKSKRKRKHPVSMERPHKPNANVGEDQILTTCLRLKAKDSLDSLTPQLGDDNQESEESANVSNMHELKNSNAKSESTEDDCPPEPPTPPVETKNRPLCSTLERRKKTSFVRSGSINSSVTVVLDNDNEMEDEDEDQDEDYVPPDDCDDEDEDYDEQEGSNTGTVSCTNETQSSIDEAQSSCCTSGSETPEVSVEELQPLDAINFPGLVTEGFQSHSLCPFTVFAATSTTRYKRINQDRFHMRTVKPPRDRSNRSGPTNVDALIGVFDGHGCLGHVAAETCSNMLPESLASSIASGETPEDAVIEAFRKTQNLLLAIGSGERKYFHPVVQRKIERSYQACMQRSKIVGTSDDEEFQKELNSLKKNGIVDADYGTTATVAFTMTHKSRGSRSLCVAHTGDSRCIVYKRPKQQTSKAKQKTCQNNLVNGWKIQYETKDHNCWQEDEKQGLIQRGGQVKNIHGDLRVLPAGMDEKEARRRCLSLNMTRSLGHIILSKKAGISSLPDVKILPLESEYEHLVVVASDGLWDHMQPSHLKHLANKYVAKPLRTEGDSNQVSRKLRSRSKRGEPDLEAFATVLMNSATAHMERVNFGDNVTVAIMRIS